MSSPSAHSLVTGFKRDSDKSPREPVLDDNDVLKVTVTSGGGGGGDGAILDGVSSAIKATVFDFTNANPLAVVLRDTNGDYVSVGGGTQYVEGATTSPATGTVALVRHLDGSLHPIALGENGEIDVALIGPIPTGGNVIGQVALTDLLNFAAGTIKLASTAPVGTDTALVVTLRDGLPSSNAAIGKVSLIDPTFGYDVTAKNSSVLPALTDKALVVTQRDPLPAGTNVIGHVIVDSGAIIANAGTNLNTSLLALEATQTNRSAKAQITDGTRDGTIKASNVAPLHTDTALVVGSADLVTLASAINTSVIIPGIWNYATDEISGATVTVRAAGVPVVPASDSAMVVITRDNVAVTGTVGINSPVGQTTAGSSIPVVLPASQVTQLTVLPTNAAQETGGNLASLVSALSGVIQVGVKQIGEQSFALGRQPVETSLPVTLATDHPIIPVQLTDGLDTLGTVARPLIVQNAAPTPVLTSVAISSLPAISGSVLITPADPTTSFDTTALRWFLQEERSRNYLQIQLAGIAAGQFIPVPEMPAFLAS